PVRTEAIVMNSAATPHSGVSEKAVQSIRSSRALTPALVAGFVMMIGVLIAAGIVDALNTRSVYATSAAVAHTNAVKAGLQQLLITAVDAETGERGFVITGEETYLEPYDRARNAISSDISQVRSLIADNREQ